MNLICAFFASPIAALFSAHYYMLAVDIYQRNKAARAASEVHPAVDPTFMLRAELEAAISAHTTLPMLLEA